MNENQTKLLRKQYDLYNNVIKPLIAAYEAREQVFPTPVFNEIRAFNDHISRCYLEDAHDEFIVDQINKASRHITRIILDLYKYLIVSFDNSIKSFEKRTKNVDLSLVENGKFYTQYAELRDQSIKCLRYAKKLEASTASSQEEIFIKFEESFNFFQDTDQLISDNHSKIQWACWKSKFKRYSWILSAILAAIISWAIKDVLDWTDWSVIDLFIKPDPTNSA